jgi:hypothetical protein
MCTFPFGKYSNMKQNNELLSDWSTQTHDGILLVEAEPRCVWWYKEESWWRDSRGSQKDL